MKNLETVQNEKVSKGACAMGLSTSLHKAESLGLEAWRNKIKAIMLEIVMMDDRVEAGIKCFKLTSLISKYLKMEKASLLELALWKAKVVDGLYFTSMEESRAYGALDNNFNARQYLSNARVECGCEVVVPSVLSYLE